VHPLIAAAAEGHPPAWAEATKSRRAHMRRVGEVMGEWALDLDLPQDDVARWRAAGVLHDALRDADFDTLRPLVGPELRDRPGRMLHGPAAAARLREEGVTDGALLLAISWHTLGHPDFDALGKALYLADYLEPGRDYASKKLARMREDVPESMDRILSRVARSRIRRMVKKGRPLLDPTVRFWNGIVGG
jgi:HD superfamily phosphohydrolase YqeK